MVELREGGDITASDMVEAPEPNSEIINFYEGSTVFLTGATGFIGKLIMEKLLRTVDNIKLYILIRPKKGKDINKRFEEIFDGPCNEPLKRKRTDYQSKVSIVLGDISQPDLGLSPEDKEKLISEVNCVIHCAATVRFDEKIRAATYTNVRSVRDILRMARQMKQLKSLLYVSTAYSNCIRSEIDESFYDPPMTGEKLLSLVECLDDDKLGQITPTLLGDYPNSYVFTKAVAENVVKEEGKNLPVGVLRPSIIIGSVKEPVAGFIDNVYGATGILLGAALGLIRTCRAKRDNYADMVPVDYVVNSCLAASWDIATMKTLNTNKETQDSASREEEFDQKIPIYNYVSTPQRPMTWGMFRDLSYKHCLQIPSELIVWHYVFAFRTNIVAHKLAILFLHMIPAYIVDFLALCIGKKPMLVKAYEKINKFNDVISYFAMRHWDFKNNNTQALWKKMNDSDHKLFDFNIKELSWDSYWYTYVRGARVYILKDPLDTIPKGTVKYYKVLVAHYLLMSFLMFVAYKVCAMIYGFLG